MSRKKTNDEFINEMYEKQPTIKPIGVYKGAFDKLECECLICGNTWYGTPKEMTGKRLRGCPKCGILKRSDAIRISKEIFLEKLNQTHNGKIIALEEYSDSKTKIKFKCLNDGYIWNGEPYRVMNGTGCPMCTNHIKKTENDFINMLKKYNPTIELISKYNSMHEHSFFKCNICGYAWETSPCHLIARSKKYRTGCPNCAGSVVPTTEEFIKRIYSINPNIEIQEDYIDNSTKIKCKCLLCEGVFYMKPTHLINGHGCRHCNSSIGENKIKQFLNKHNIIYEPQKFFDDLKGLKGRVLSYDFYLSEYNLLIEFQGKQHEKAVKHFGGEEQFKIQQEHDKRKRDYAKLNKIRLLEIWYYDLNNIEYILKDYLLEGEVV